MIEQCLPAIETAGVRWKESIHISCGRVVPQEAFDDFRRVAINRLRYQGLLIETPKRPSPYGDLMPKYIFHIKVTRGMTQGSVKNTGHRVLWFLRWAEQRREVFADITYQNVEQYIAEDRIPRVKLRTVASSCAALRIFFRYAEREGLTRNRIAAGILVPSVPRYDPSPRGPRWNEVRKMIGAASGEKSTDLRARAVLLLLAIYGLRSSEVSRLSVDDIDWFDESFLIRRAKHGGTQRFPLQYEVGEAILRYLRHGRSACDSRSLFVTVSAWATALCASERAPSKPSLMNAEGRDREDDEDPYPARHRRTPWRYPVGQLRQVQLATAPQQAGYNRLEGPRLADTCLHSGYLHRGSRSGLSRQRPCT
jgi:integrase/recombinase XerD